MIALRNKKFLDQYIESRKHAENDSVKENVLFDEDFSTNQYLASISKDDFRNLNYIDISFEIDDRGVDGLKTLYDNAIDKFTKCIEKIKNEEFAKEDPRFKADWYAKLGSKDSSKDTWGGRHAIEFFKFNIHLNSKGEQLNTSDFDYNYFYDTLMNLSSALNKLNSLLDYLDLSKLNKLVDEIDKCVERLNKAAIDNNYTHNEYKEYSLFDYKNEVINDFSEYSKVARESLKYVAGFIRDIYKAKRELASAVELHEHNMTILSKYLRSF